jgi:hypothetical protein
LPRFFAPEVWVIGDPHQAMGVAGDQRREVWSRLDGEGSDPYAGRVQPGEIKPALLGAFEQPLGPPKGVCPIGGADREVCGPRHTVILPGEVTLTSYAGRITQGLDSSAIALCEICMKSSESIDRRTALI